jgi:hypothetical protein
LKKGATSMTAEHAKQPNPWLHKIVRLLPALASLVIAVGTLLATSQILRPTTDNTNAILTKAEVQSQINGVARQLEELRLNVEIVRNQIQDIGKNNPKQSVVALQLKTLDQSVSENQKKLTSLEAVILDNPQKALALPLIRRDIDGLKESYQTNIIASKQDIDRIYDQSKWFIGLMITTAVGMMALAISNFFKKT